MKHLSCAAAVIFLASSGQAQVLTAPLSTLPESKLTASCNTVDATELIIEGSDQVRADIYAAVTGGTDADLVSRLWRPGAARQTSFQVFENWVVVAYDPVQDLAEIGQAIAADAMLAARGVRAVHPNGYSCFAAMPPPPLVSVTEYYHPLINHYVLSTRSDEGMALEAAGWQLTGEAFTALQASGGVSTCYGVQPVFRFRLAPGWRGSRFLTVDARECGALRRLDPGWRPDGVAFDAAAPTGDSCPRGVPVYRAYNGRARFNDSNHRFTTRVENYQRMISEGWIGEGVALCAYSH